MFTISGEAPLNPDPSEPQLDHEAAWRGLERWLRVTNESDPDLVPEGHVFEILRDWGSSLFRRGELPALNKTSFLKITFHAPWVAVAEHFAGFQRGVMMHMISTDLDGDLLLKMMLIMDFTDREVGSPEESELIDIYRATWETLPDQVVGNIRTLAFRES